MPAVPKKHKRSRNGCSKCKDSHLKCDESRPACFRCQRRKLTCPGYPGEVRWSAKHERFQLIQTEVQSGAIRTPADIPSERSLVSSSDGNLTVYAQSSQQSNPSSPFATSWIRDGNSEVQNPTVDTESTTLDGFDTQQIDYWSIFENMASDCLHSNLLEESDLNIATPRTDNRASSSSQPELPGTAASLASPGRVSSCYQDSTSNSRKISPLLPAVDEETIVLRHYFDSVCILNSVFDSRQNPLRYVVTRSFNSSLIIYKAVLSISSTHLGQWSVRPGAQEKAAKYRSATVDSLDDLISRMKEDATIRSEQSRDKTDAEQTDSINDVERALFVCLFLGVSSSWTNPSNLGIPYLTRTRKLFKAWLSLHGEPTNHVYSQIRSHRDKSFLVGLTAYWEACISFVLDQPVDAVDYLKPFLHNDPTEMVHLNPWTGLCTPNFISLAQAGILSRHKQHLVRMRVLEWPKQFHDNINKELLGRATQIEDFLSHYSIPTKPQIYDTEDSSASFDSLKSLAVAYRLATMLELYRNFPELCGSRRPTAMPQNMDTTFPVPSGMENSHLLQDSQGSHTRLLFEIATNILSILEELSDGYGFSLSQTLALLISATALQVGAGNHGPQTSQGKPWNLMSDLAATAMRPQVVLKWRDFVRRRLQRNAELMRIQSFSRPQQLLEAVWSRMDEASTTNKDPSSANWLHVMTECKLETLYG